MLANQIREDIEEMHRLLLEVDEAIARLESYADSFMYETEPSALRDRPEHMPNGRSPIPHWMHLRRQ